MKAIWQGHVIAQSSETITIEGNHYFPVASVQKNFLTNSDLKTICPWKGEANYYNIQINDKVNENACWYYPNPLPRAKDIVGKDFSNYIAFWNGVEITD